MLQKKTPLGGPKGAMGLKRVFGLVLGYLNGQLDSIFGAWTGVARDDLDHHKDHQGSGERTYLLGGKAVSLS